MNFLIKDLKHKVWKGKFISIKRLLIIWNMKSLLKIISFKSTDIKFNYPTRRTCKSSNTNKILNISANKLNNLIMYSSEKTMITNNFSANKTTFMMISEDSNKQIKLLEWFTKRGKNSLIQC